jgi:sugar phosphate isomerase/epimerase
MTANSRKKRTNSNQTGAESNPMRTLREADQELESPLGFQIFSVRARVAQDLPGTLRQVAAMGYTVVELCSFKGLAGDKIRGDFGPLADMSTTDLCTILKDVPMTVRGCHFYPPEFEEQNIDRSIAWAAEVGVNHMIIGPPITHRDKTMDEWKQTFDELNRYGEYIRKAGRQFCYHPQADMWETIDGVLVFDELLQSVDPENCLYELDLSASFINGIDAGDYMASHPGRFFAVHLRDLRIPRQPVPYIFSLPLGQGEVDWKKVLSGAKKGAVENYIVEMIVQPPGDPVDALRVSAEYLHNLRF